MQEKLWMEVPYLADPDARRASVAAAFAALRERVGSSSTLDRVERLLVAQATLERPNGPIYYHDAFGEDAPRVGCVPLPDGWLWNETGGGSLAYGRTNHIDLYAPTGERVFIGHNGYPGKMMGCDWCVEITRHVRVPVPWEGEYVHHRRQRLGTY